MLGLACLPLCRHLPLDSFRWIQPWQHLRYMSIVGYCVQAWHNALWQKHISLDFSVITSDLPQPVVLMFQLFRRKRIFENIRLRAPGRLP